MPQTDFFQMDLATDPGVVVLGSGTNAFEWVSAEERFRAMWKRNEHDECCYFPLTSLVEFDSYNVELSFKFSLTISDQNAGSFGPNTNRIGISPNQPAASSDTTPPRPFLGMRFITDTDNGAPLMDGAVFTDTSSGSTSSTSYSQDGTYEVEMLYNRDTGQMSFIVDGTAIGTSSPGGSMDGVYEYVAIPPNYVGGGSVDDGVEIRVDDIVIRTTSIWSRGADSPMIMG